MSLLALLLQIEGNHHVFNLCSRIAPQKKAIQSPLRKGDSSYTDSSQAYLAESDPGGGVGGL